MPYIKPETRKELNPMLENLIDRLDEKDLWAVGNLNFLITELLWTYFEDDRCYQSINDILGILEGVKAEFLRRKAFPYEDEKIEENGDITLYERPEQ